MSTLGTYFVVARNTWDEAVAYRLSFTIWRFRNLLQLITTYFLWFSLTPQPAFSFGSSIHLALKEFYSRALQGEEMTAKKIPEILESVWISEGYHGKAHVTAALTGARNMLINYIEKNFTTAKLPIELELPFQFSLGDLKIGGRIDRIDKLPDGSIEIIDYKTGRNPIDEKRIKNNLQLSIYRLAAKCIPYIMNNDQLPPIKISLHYIETGQIVSGILSEKDLEKASEKILMKAQEIETSDFACSKSLLCEDCEYALLCQAKI